MGSINVSLTTIGAQQFLMGLFSDHAEKANLGNMKDNDTKTRKVCVDGNKH